MGDAAPRFIMELHSSVERPRVRGLVYALVGGSLVAGAFLLLGGDDVAPPAPITKVEVAPMAPAAAPVVVPIHVEQPPLPEPDVESEATPDPDPELEGRRARALAPHLDAECVVAYDAEPRTSCMWDDGFPAVSRDGKTIVTKRYDDDGGRGYPNLHIDFIDVATSKVTSSVKILDSDEFDPETQKHVAKVERRVKSAQRKIDAGNFRSGFVLLAPTDSQEPSWSHLRTEHDEGAIRIIDPGTGVAIWRASYSGKTEFPHLKDEDLAESMCGGAHAHEVQAWWDEESRIVITTASFRTGGCMCPTLFKTYINRVQ